MRILRPGGILVVLALASLVAADQTCLLDDVSLVGRWQPDVWNRAPGSVAPAADAPPGIAGGRALEVRVDWPKDDEFRFFSIQPQPSRGPIPYRVKEVSLWVRGVDDPHFLEVYFKDAKGADAKIGLGAASFQGWRKLSQPVPAEIAQPLTFTSLTWHSWGLKGAGGTIVTAVARLEVVIDETQRLVPGEDTPELLVASEGPSGLADADGKAAVDVAVLSWRSQPRKLALQQELLAADGASVKRLSTDIDFAGEYGSSTKWSLPACRAAVTRYQCGLPSASGSSISSLRLPPLRRRLRLLPARDVAVGGTQGRDPTGESRRAAGARSNRRRAPALADRREHPPRRSVGDLRSPGHPLGAGLLVELARARGDGARRQRQRSAAASRPPPAPPSRIPTRSSAPARPAHPAAHRCGRATASCSSCQPRLWRCQTECPRL